MRLNSKNISSRSKNWLKIWNRKGKNLISKKTRDILSANGHDSPLGKISKKKWIEYLNNKVKKIKIKKNSNILEYGCGSGAFLSHFYNNKYNLYGIDYSKNQIEKAKKFFPNIHFKVGEISEIDKFKIKFDFIFSNVVFHYFDNYSYANNLIKKMLSNLNSNGTIYITNIPDLNKKNLYFKEIINNIGLKEYNKRYNKNTHLFYDKLFFKQIAKKNKLNVKIFDESLTSSKNYKFRFNVIFEKTK